MATEIYAASLGEIRTISTAGGGTALTTTAAFTTLLIGTHWLSVTPRNFATAAVAKVAFNPYLLVLKTTDALATAANITDASDNMQDGSTATTLVLNSFNTAANNNYLYVGAHLPIRGVRVVIGNTNSNASVLTVKYWNGSAWTDITATDGTTGGGASFNATGNVTWTVPTTWTKAPLSSAGASGIGDTSLVAGTGGGAGNALMTPYFWTRWETSAQFDATVTATEMQSMGRNTAQYAELLTGQTLEETVHRGPGGIGNIEALTDAGTANLIINVATRITGGGFNS